MKKTAGINKYKNKKQNLNKNAQSIKSFTVNCKFSGGVAPVTFYVGNAAVGLNPISKQAEWLIKEKGGRIPADIMDSLDQVKKIADEQNTDFVELFGYVLDEVNLKNSSKNDKKK